MNDLTKLVASLTIASTVALSGCGNESAGSADATHSDGGSHDHGTGDHDHVEESREAPGHADEVPLGSVTIGEITIDLAQGHGSVEPGKEMHLVVKLPYSDNGATVIRSWLGTENRFASVVAKGEYATSHDDYDIHATAPDPLPENTMWWIEIEKPDGQKLLGSTSPR